MFKNEGGFSVAEGLIAISCLLIITSYICPMMFRMIDQMAITEREMTAERMLYEEVERYFVNKIFKDSLIEEDGYSYSVHWQNSEDFIKEACVAFEKEDGQGERCVRFE